MEDQQYKYGIEFSVLKNIWGHIVTAILNLEDTPAILMDPYSVKEYTLAQNVPIVLYNCSQIGSHVIQMEPYAVRADLVALNVPNVL